MSINVLKPGLTRRQFLKTTAAAAAIVPLMQNMSLDSIPQVVPNALPGAVVPQEAWLGGECNMCRLSDCVNRAHLIDGVVVGVEGNPDSPVNKGRLCPRGLSAVINLYNPYRVKAPMKRTNPEKGLDVDPKWVEISWDEAFSIVCGKLSEARKADPRTLMLNTGFGVRETSLRTLFLNAFGSPNSVSSNGPLCAVHYATNLVQANHPISTSDLSNVNYHITIGRSVGANHGVANGGSLHLVTAIERGLKFISIDPRSSPESALGEWVPIRPGTDLAFALAMTNTMMHEVRVFDLYFLKNRTNAPYLLSADGEYLRDASSKKPLIWDVSDSKAKTFDDPTLKDPALEGSFTVNGVTTLPAFQTIKDRIKQYTPEWQEPITTIPAATVRRLANEFVQAAQIGSTTVIDGFTFPYRPASIIAERGSIAKKNGTNLDLATKWINLMIGNIEVPGGVVGMSNRGPVLQPDADGVVTPRNEAVGVAWSFPPNLVDQAAFFPNRHTTIHLAYKTIEDPQKYFMPYTVRVVWIYGGNSIRGTANPDMIVRALKKVPFVFEIAYHYDATAEMSDVLLPEHAMLERRTVTTYSLDQQSNTEAMSLWGELGRSPVPPVFNSKDGDEIMIEMADRIGILKGKGGVNDLFNASQAKDFQLNVDKRYTLEEMLDLRVRSLEKGKFGLKDLESKGFLLRRESTKLSYNYYYFPDKKTRHSFYFYRLKYTSDALKANLAKAGVKIPNVDMNDLLQHYDPIPHWIPSADFNGPADYDLFVINWKIPMMMFGIGGCEENPWFDEIIDETNPYVRTINISQVTADKKGLKDGDEVWVESRYGKTRGKLKTSQLFHPDVIGIAGCYGAGTMHMNPIARKGPHYNRLLSTDESTMDPISGGVDTSPRVKIYKA